MEAMQTQTAAEVAKWVFAYICRRSRPIRILTDQGKCFEAELFKELLALLDIDKSRNTPYHPQCDVHTKRFNSTLEGMLRCFIQDNPADWDEYLKPLAFAYNTAVHATTGVSPFQMVYGRLPRLPIERVLEEGRTAEIEISKDIDGSERVADDNIHREVDEVIEMINMGGDNEYDRELVDIQG